MTDMPDLTVQASITHFIQHHIRQHFTIEIRALPSIGLQAFSGTLVAPFLRSRILTSIKGERHE
jgi:hypothetical protein